MYIAPLILYKFKQSHCLLAFPMLSDPLCYGIVYRIYLI